MAACQPLDTALAPAVDFDTRSGAVYDELSALRGRIEEISPDLVGISQRLAELSEEVEQKAPECRDEVLSLLVRMDTEPTKSLAKEQEKWVKAGFDRALLKTDPKAVHFAVLTKLVYTIAMYEKSAAMLEGEPLTVRNVNGTAHFKVEGQWMPYAAFENQIQYSLKLEKFLGWNFIHPQGFVKQDRFEYDRVYPIARMSKAGYESVLAHAQKFSDEPQPDKSCVLQVTSTGRDLLPKAWWAKNVREHSPEHSSVRLIMANGDVYSWGIELLRPAEQFLSRSEHYMATGLSSVSVPDYEDPRTCDERAMVALPVSSEGAERVLDFVSRANKGIPFNLSRQNCVRFTEHVLHVAGVKMTSRISSTEFLEAMVPRLSDIPRLGRIVSAICSVATKVFSGIDAAMKIIPPLRWVWTAVKKAVAHSVDHLSSIAVNTLSLLALGGSTSIIPQSAPDDSKVSEVDHFDRAVTWRTLFTHNAIPIYHTVGLKRWMHEQKNLIIFLKPQYGFCCWSV